MPRRNRPKHVKPQILKRGAFKATGLAHTGYRKSRRPGQREGRA